MLTILLIRFLYAKMKKMNIENKFDFKFNI